MENPQDVGGVLANDPFPSTAVSAPDEVDTPLSVALEESEKPKQVRMEIKCYSEHLWHQYLCLCVSAWATTLTIDVRRPQFWEYQTHAVYTLLLDKGLITAAGVRRAIESLPRAAFKRCAHR